MLEIALLGEQRIVSNGKPIDALRSPRTLGLLAYLAVHAGTPQLRQHVAGVFWPDSTDAQARTNLRRELHQIRAALPSPDRYLTVDAHAITWSAAAPCRLDVAEFRVAAADADTAEAAGDDAGFRSAATRAVRAYGGELLPAFYDDWVLAERDQLRRRCVALLDRLAVVSDGREAIEHAQRRVELEPLEESGYRTLMALQAGAGDRAAALHTFHRCTAVLERDLGVEPSADTLSVYRSLHANRAEPSVETRELRAGVPLVGRAAELGLLHAAWAQVTDGPVLVAVVGEAGVGKSRLVHQLAADAQAAGAAVARARCFPSEGRLVLGPVAEWLRSPGLRQRAEQLDPVWRREVGRLVPELGTEGGPTEPAPLGDAWQRRQFFEAMARAVLSEDRSTLLVLDDVQWCDGETLAWIEFLLHLDPGARLLVATTLRGEEVEDNPDVVTSWRRLRAAGLLRELEIGPLSLSDTAELAAAIEGRPVDADRARQLQAQTGGFPLFVVEAGRQGALRSSRTDAVLASRLAQLSPTAADLAGVAAAIGRDFSLDLLGAAGDVDEDTLVTAVDELWRRRLLREHSSTTYDFAHDLLRAAAYDTLTPPHRRLLHRRIGAALETIHQGDPGPVAALIADQFQRGGQPERAVRYHTLAGETATSVFAFNDSLRHYRQALDLVVGLAPGPQRDRQELDLQLAVTPHLNALLGYSAPELGATLQRAVVLSDQLADQAAAARSRSGLWAHLFVRGEIDAAAALAEDLVSRLADCPDLAGQINLDNGGVLASAGRVPESLRFLERSLSSLQPDELHAVGVNVRVMAQAWRAHPLWVIGRTEDAGASALASLASAESLDHPYSRAVAHGYSAITFHLVGDAERAGAVATAARSLCERYGFAYYSEWSRIIEGRLAGGPAGEVLIREGIDRLHAQHARSRMPFWLGQLAEVLLGRGRTSEATDVLADAREWAGRHGDRWWLAEIWRLDAAARPDVEAEPLLRRAVAVARHQHALALELRATTDLARRSAEAGRLDDAAALLGDLRSRAGGCNESDLAAADEVLAGLPA